MRLTTKLFVFVGALLLVICVVVYLVPAYLTEEQLQIDREEYLKVVRNQRLREQQHMAELLGEDVGSLAGEIDAALLLAAGHGELKEALLADGPSGAGGVWQAAVQLLAYTEEIDFLQVVKADNVQAAITLSNARLYVAKPFPVGRDMAWMLLDVTEEDGSAHDEVYISVWLPSRDERIAGVETVSYRYPTTEIHLLFDPVPMLEKPDQYTDILKERRKELEKLSLPGLPNAGAMAIELLQRLDRAAKFLVKTFGDASTENVPRLKDYVESLRQQRLELPVGDATDAISSGARKHSSNFLGLISPTKPPPTAVPVGEAQVFWWTLTRILRRANDLELIGAMGLLAATGVIGDSPFAPGAPVGAARIQPEREVGSAVLGRDVFREDLLFDAGPLLKEYPPLTPNVPISSGFGLVKHGQSVDETMVNSLALRIMEPDETLKVEGYLTLGASFSVVMAKLAEQTNQTTILLVDGKVTDYVDRAKAIVTQPVIDALNQQARGLKGPVGFVHLGDREFYYSRYPVKPEWDLHFLTLESADDVLGPIREFENRSQKMADQLTWHIMLAAVIVFVLALIALELIARQFTKPIRTLATATQKVSEGKYTDVELPRAKEGSHNEIAILASSFREMVDGLAEREKIRSVLDKVVSKEIADEILEGKVHLGGEVKEVTVLFADIRNFTALTENLAPSDVITFVNSYMTVMTEIIERHQGVIDKYIGDEVMALYGAPIEHPYSKLQAVLSALIIQKSLGEWNEERREQGLITADVGIGIHSGPVVVGNMGAEDRLNYTVLGKNVNLAARLADEATGTEIWVTEEVTTDAHVANAIKFDERERVQLKGITDPVRVFRVLSLRQGFIMGSLSEEARSRARGLED